MSKKPAFTVIEILVVLTLVAALAVPSFLAIGKFRNQQAMDSAVAKLESAFKQARIYARESKDGVGWGVVLKDSSTFVLVSGIPTDFEAQSEFVLSDPVRFETGSFAVWFDQGSGNTAFEQEIGLRLPNGESKTVTVSSTGIVETL
jgi:type II secretory pathway pseudopilin PulG